MTPEYSYVDQIDIDEDLYLKSGWWSGLSVNPPAEERIRFGGGIGLDTSQDGTDAVDQQQKIRWLYLTSGTDAPERSFYNIDVTANGGVVAAMDVFKAYQGNGDMTPDCPQRIVEEILPQEDDEQIGYLFRVLHETTDYHQRTAGVGGANTMSVELNPQQASGDKGEPDGFVVAIYPQAASHPASQTEETNIEFELSIDESTDSSTDFLVKDNKNSEQPDLPFDRDDWAGSPDDVDDCRERGLKLPPSLQDESAQELPGAGTVEDRLTTLLDSHLG